jgi:hypothetical protein
MATPEIKSKAELELKITPDQKLNTLRESVKAEVDSQRKLTAYKDFLKAFDPIKSPEWRWLFRITIGGQQYDIAESILEEDAKDILQLEVDLKETADTKGKLTFEVIATFKQELNPLLETISTSPDKAKQVEVNNTLQKVIDDQRRLQAQFEQFLVNNTPTEAQADVQKLLDLSKTLKTLLISRDARFAGAMAASASAALKEQNDYLELVIKWYEADPKFKAPKFKPNKKIAADMQNLIEQFGTPEQKKSFANVLDPNLLDPNPAVDKPISPEKPAEKVPETDAEKVTMLKNLIAWLDVAMTNKKQSIDATTGQVYIDVTKDEYAQFMLLKTLTEQVNDNKPDANEVYDRDMSARERRRTIKSLKKSVASEQKKSRDMKQIAWLEEQNARLKNDVNYLANRANITHGISEVLSTGKYLNQTISYQPRSPLFTNICQSLDAFSVKGIIQVNFAGNPNVFVRCPEMMNLATTTYIDGFAKRFAPGEYTSFAEANGVHTPNILETFFLKNTKMSPEQARKNASLLSTGWLLAGLFFGVKWLIKGSGKDDKTNFIGRAAIIAWSLLGANMLSQGLTGRSAGDFIKDIWSGKLGFSDIMNGKWFGVEVKTPQLTAASIALNGIPYGVLSTVTKEGSNGYPTINFDLLEKSLEARLLVATWEEKQKLQQQLDAVKNLHKDPKGQQYIDQALTDLGIKQKDLTAPENKDKTVDAKIEDAQERVRKLAAYEQEKNLRIKDMRDASVVSYISTGKPSLDDLAKDGKFVAATQKPGVDGLSEAQRNIDPELAQAGLPDDVALSLDDAMNKVNGTINFKVANNRPWFLFEGGKLFIRSYGLNTPISITEGNYKVSTLDIMLPGAQEAIKTANLINFLIMSNNGQRDNDAPFAFSGKDITIWNEGIFGWKWLDSKLVWIKKKYYNTTVVDGADFKRWPWSSSSLEDIGGIQLNSQWWKFATYLNGLKNNKNQSIWKVDQGVASTSEILWFATWLAALPKRKSVDNKQDDAAEENNTNKSDKSTKKKKKSAWDDEKKKSDKKSETSTAIPVEKASSWKEKYKLKDAAGKELPEDFYKAWIGASNNKQRLFVYGGEVYDREPGTSKAAHIVDKKDSPEEATARAAAVAAKKEFKNRREALIAGDAIMTRDNGMTCTYKEGFTRVWAEGDHNFAVEITAFGVAQKAAKDAAEKAWRPFKTKQAALADGDITLDAAGKPQPKTWYERVDTKDTYNCAVKAISSTSTDNKDVLSIDDEALKAYEKALNTYLPTLSAKAIQWTIWNLRVEADKKSKEMKVLSSSASGDLSLWTLMASEYASAGDTLNKEGVNKKIEELAKLRLNNFNLVKEMSGKIYTCKDLFGTSLEEQPVQIQNFFNKTKNWGSPCVRIDNRPAYTSLKNNGAISYSFDFDWGSDPKRINNLEYENYNPDFKEADFRAILRDKIKELAKEHQGENY